MVGLLFPERDKPLPGRLSRKLHNWEIKHSDDKCEVPTETERSFNDEITSALLVLGT